MNEKSLHELRFGESGEAQLREYKPVNRWAVTALAVALASPLALAHWLLCIIPIGAVVLALASLRSGKDEPKNTGGKAALAALALGMFFCSFAVSRNITMKQSFEAQARQHAEDWLALVRDGSLPKLHEAYELSLSYRERQVAGADLNTRYGSLDSQRDGSTVDSTDPTPRGTFASFFDREPVKSILAAGPTADLQFRGFEGRWSQGNSDFYRLAYSIRLDDGGKTKSVPFEIEMKRNIVERLGQAHWQVNSVEASDPIDVPISALPQ